MRIDRFFYTGSAVLFLMLIVFGFHKYIFEGKHVDGSAIEAQMEATVAIHSASVFAWYLLFFVQSVLISVGKRQLHRKLGWSVLAVATVIAVTGPLVAIRSTRSSAFGVAVFDWSGPQFLLIMFVEFLMFVAFVTAGLVWRARVRVHRSMMMLASLTMISGATGRIEWIGAVFGSHQWTALFGPVAALGVLLLVVRLVMTRRFDQEFACGLAGWIFVTAVAAGMAGTEAWGRVAGIVLKL